MGAKCDRCGNFDEGYREEMEYQLYDDHCIQAVSYTHLTLPTMDSV